MCELALVAVGISAAAIGFDSGVTYSRRQQRKRLDSRLKNDAAEIARGRWLRRRK